MHDYTRMQTWESPPQEGKRLKPFPVYPESRQIMHVRVALMNGFRFLPSKVFEPRGAERFRLCQSVSKRFIIFCGVFLSPA
jgi:hypothetical protein